MSMDAQELRVREWFVEEEIVWVYEFPCGGHIDADAEHIAIVHGVWVRVADSECGDGPAGPVEVLLVV